MNYQLFWIPSAGVRNTENCKVIPPIIVGIDSSAVFLREVTEPSRIVFLLSERQCLLLSESAYEVPPTALGWTPALTGIAKVLPNVGDTMPEKWNGNITKAYIMCTDIPCKLLYDVKWKFLFRQFWSKTLPRIAVRCSKIRETGRWSNTVYSKTKEDTSIWVVTIKSF